jgi:dienelactone hydrolase
MRAVHHKESETPTVGTIKTVQWWAVAFRTTLILLLSALPHTTHAGQPQFRLHVLNAESTYSACAAVDVNRDGKLDVVGGGWWYEAPHWTPHFVRDVEVIRGRYDDYSNLPMDVDGDGWSDLVSANYRSAKIYWIEHPGEKLGPWATHEIAAPGPSETARLVDVDADGRLDLLPNGTSYAAWWELVREEAGGRAGIQWVRHELPKELAAHGIGFGDVDGDGRGDLVGPRGWFQAPEDRRNGTWQWHKEFELHRDACIPILVFDVDGDGDNDVVWSRAHSTGLYWYEQVRHGGEAQGPRRWVLHAIDTSSSQAHALLFGDLDNDGQPEVVAGKRYLGHDGRDLGEYDPMIISAYTFQRDTKTWRRNVISVGGAAGFGLDPKLVDLDADGDLDIIGPGRSGLFWFENLLGSSATEAAAALPQWPAADYDDHTALLAYKNDKGQLLPVSSHAEWGIRRAHVLASMQQVMGPLPGPSRRVPLDVRLLEEVKTPKYIRRRISFAAEPGDRVPAYLLVPVGLRATVPAMLCLHQTTLIGKDEPAGLGGQANLHYAHELAERGYVCIVPDYPSFGDYEYDFRKQGSGYASGSMKAVWNNIRAIDLLETLPEVDRDRIGCIGHSLGAHNALFTAVFDQRIKAIVSSCGFSAFHDDDLPSWTSDRYMPRIREVYGNDPDRLPFDFHEVLGALAPRAVFVNAPLGDHDFDVGGVQNVMGATAALYELLDARDRLEVVHPDGPHDFPGDVRRRAYDWLAKILQ